MAEPAKPSTPPGHQERHAGTSPGNRSEALLPADDDANLQVAEEVAFDLQSDQSRKIGSLPDGQGGVADAVADTLTPEARPEGGKATRTH